MNQRYKKTVKTPKKRPPAGKVSLPVKRGKPSRRACPVGASTPKISPNRRRRPRAGPGYFTCRDCGRLLPVKLLGNVKSRRCVACDPGSPGAKSLKAYKETLKDVKRKMEKISPNRRRRKWSPGPPTTDPRLSTSGAETVKRFNRYMADLWPGSKNRAVKVEPVDEANTPDVWMTIRIPEAIMLGRVKKIVKDMIARDVSINASVKYAEIEFRFNPAQLEPDFAGAARRPVGRPKKSVPSSPPPGQATLNNRLRIIKPK